MVVRGNRRISVLAGGGGALAALWGVITATQAVVESPSKANAFWAFLVNTPDSIPWVLAAGMILLFIWSFWPRPVDDERADWSTTSASGTGAQVFGAPVGRVEIHNHHYGDLVREANQMQAENESAAEASPLNHFFSPTVTQTGGQLEDATMSATGVLFPLGLFVGMVIVSAGRLSEENTLELVIRAFNGTGRQLRLAFVEGAIHGGQGNLRDLPGLPLPTIRPDPTPPLIEPYSEFTIVLDQTVSPTTASDFMQIMETAPITLFLEHLNIVMEIADEPANRSRLPLWDAVSIRRRDDVFTGRVFVMSAAGSASGHGTVDGRSA